MRIQKARCAEDMNFNEYTYWFDRGAASLYNESSLPERANREEREAWMDGLRSAQALFDNKDLNG